MKIVAPILVTLATLMGGMASAQDPANPTVALVGPADPVPVKSAVFLDASRSFSVYPLAWSCKPPVPIISMDQGGHLGIYGMIPPTQLQPGVSYLVTVTALGRKANGDPVAASDSFIFKTETTAAPTPQPNPVPAAPDAIPNSVPVPESEQLYATVFYPSGDRSVSSLLNSTLRDSLKSIKVAWHIWPDQARKTVNGQISDTTILQDSNLTSQYPGNGPVLFIQRADGTLLTGTDGKADGVGIVNPAPSDPQKVFDRLMKIRGTK